MAGLVFVALSSIILMLSDRLLKLVDIKQWIEKVLVTVVFHFETEHIFFFDEVVHKFRKQTI